MEHMKKSDDMLVLEEHPRWLWVREADGTEHPVYRDGRLEQQIEGYFLMAERRPELFAPSPLLPLCMDRHALLRFAEESGRDVGLVFDNGKFYQVVADLIAAPRPFLYARVLYPDRKGNGTVMVPRLLRDGAEPLYGILHVYRHTIRAMSGGEFPRGFQEPDITPEENARKELREEFGVEESQLTRMVLLGESRADTGLSSGSVRAYLAELRGEVPRANIGEEGIAGFEWIGARELTERIRRGEIRDGMTLCALALLHAWEEAAT